jgi:hypothetical protein
MISMRGKMCSVSVKFDKFMYNDRTIREAYPFDQNLTAYLCKGTLENHNFSKQFVQWLAQNDEETDEHDTQQIMHHELQSRLIKLDQTLNQFQTIAMGSILPQSNSINRPSKTLSSLLLKKETISPANRKLTTV